ncbi:hypothetical protein E2C01_036137 [Portunus trituberculatus]|uniref:Uncharacterized protein n=1 Tax=Portunus trituberculatus TaxID=210409 RepID=A0A5B7FAI4_PORTR|nr:hypothetical protein [Portunus trituberculatus]
MLDSIDSLAFVGKALPRESGVYPPGGQQVWLASAAGECEGDRSLPGCKWLWQDSGVLTWQQALPAPSRCVLAALSSLMKVDNV